MLVGEPYIALSPTSAKCVAGSQDLTVCELDCGQKSGAVTKGLHVLSMSGSALVAVCSNT